jgi:HEAT repeat protein/predicted phosphodiesterase
MAGITWLHLSDWHQKGAEFDRQVVRDALVRDIREREKIHHSLAKVHFVVFSGDLAWNGEAGEFEAARNNLLDPVLQATGLKPDRLFCVPGNHDLNRSTIYDMLPPELQKPLDSDALVKKWLTDDRRRARLLEPFETYREFISRRYSGQPSPDYASVVRWDVHGIDVALLGLNSAWMCARVKDTKGEVNDYGSLLVGEPQFHNALVSIADADLRIGVLHHTFDFLAEFDRSRLEERLQHEVHFVLRGHQHQPQVQHVHGTGGDYVVIPAGAGYKERMAADPRYTNAYNWVHLDLDAGQGMVYLRRWSDRQNAWVADRDTYDKGQYLIKPLPKKLRSGAGSARAAPPRPAARTAAAEARYRDLLLETCDIINLANLPEQDRHLALKQQQLRLRGLYIPLRVCVEAPAEQEGVQAKEEASLWQDVEERRAAQRGWTQKAVDRERQRVPVGERLAAARRLVVLGDPGAGKTTLTRWLATAYLLRHSGDSDWKVLPDADTLPQEDWLPIIIRCRDLDADCLHGSLEDMLRHSLRKAQLSDAQVSDVCALLLRRLDQGEALLMLDGLDEITDPGVRACFCQQLEQVVVAYPKAPILATSRIVGYREMGYRLGRGFEHVTVADLTSEEQDDFARRWCALTEVGERRQSAAEELIHDIHSTERIERLTRNPMLLTTLALVKRKVGKLPSRRADLYGEAVQVLLNWRPEVDEPLDWREAIPQLEYLAYAMCDRGVQQLRQDEVLQQFARMREEYPNVHTARKRTPEQFLRTAEARTAILSEAGHVRHLGILLPVYEFRHLTFQEYLAARALVDGRFPGRDPSKGLAAQVGPLAGRTADVMLPRASVREEAVEENWREALRLCAAMCSDDDVDDVLLAISTPREGEQPGVARARAVLAALCLADEPNASAKVSTQVLEEFAARVERADGTISVARTALDGAAMELAGTRWAGTLRAALIGEFCRRIPSARGGPGGLLAMVAVFDVPFAKPGLTDWLAQQEVCLRTSAECEAIAAALSLMEGAFEGKVPNIPGLIDALLSRLSGSPPMSHAAAWALAWLNRRASDERGPWKPTAKQRRTLAAFLRDRKSDPHAVLFVLWIVEAEGIAQAVEPLLFWLESDIPDVRMQVATTLGKVRAKAAVAGLLARLDDRDAGVRRAAVGALGAIKGEAVVAGLLVRLEDGDAGVRGAAAEALGAIKSKAAVAGLLARLEDGDASVRGAAAEALGAIKSKAAVAGLLGRLDDGDAGVRSAAARALGEIKSKAAVAGLLARLEDGDADVRRAALGGLAQALEVVDRQLLSSDLDGIRPFVDPRQPIAEADARRAAERLKLAIEDVKARYEALAERFHLRLEWRWER